MNLKQGTDSLPWPTGQIHIFHCLFHARLTFLSLEENKFCFFKAPFLKPSKKLRNEMNEQYNTETNRKKDKKKKQ